MATAVQSRPIQSSIPWPSASLSPGSQPQAFLQPAFHVHIPVPTVGAISSWQVAGKGAFCSLQEAASFSLPSVARRTDNCLYLSCAVQIKPIFLSTAISPARPILMACLLGNLPRVDSTPRKPSQIAQALALTCTHFFLSFLNHGLILHRKNPKDE